MYGQERALTILFAGCLVYCDVAIISFTNQIDSSRDGNWLVATFNLPWRWVFNVHTFPIKDLQNCLLTPYEKPPSNFEKWLSSQVHLQFRILLYLLVQMACIHKLISCHDNKLFHLQNWETSLSSLLQTPCLYCHGFMKNLQLSLPCQVLMDVQFICT